MLLTVVTHTIPLITLKREVELVKAERVREAFLIILIKREGFLHEKNSTRSTSQSLGS